MRRPRSPPAHPGSAPTATPRARAAADAPRAFSRLCRPPRRRTRSPTVSPSSTTEQRTPSASTDTGVARSIGPGPRAVGVAPARVPGEQRRGPVVVGADDHAPTGPHPVQEVPEALEDPGVVAVDVEMVLLHVGHDRDVRRQTQEGAVVLVGLHHEEGARAEPEVALPPGDPAPYEAGRIESRTHEDLGRHRGGRGLPVRPRDRDHAPAGNPRAERLGPLEDGNPATARGHQLGVVLRAPRTSPRGRMPHRRARASCPTRTDAPRVARRRMASLSFASHPLTRPPLRRTSSASAHIPAPPMPTKWTGPSAARARRSTSRALIGCLPGLLSIASMSSAMSAAAEGLAIDSAAAFMSASASGASSRRLDLAPQMLSGEAVLHGHHRGSRALQGAGVVRLVIGRRRRERDEDCGEPLVEKLRRRHRARPSSRPGRRRRARPGMSSM